MSDRQATTGEGISWLGFWLFLGLCFHGCEMTVNVPKALIKEAYGPATPATEGE
jgi:hypothetical protein